MDIPEAELDAHYASSYGIFGGRADKVALLLFTPRASTLGRGRDTGIREQQGKRLEDGSYELRIPYSDPRELVMDILRHGPQVRVMEPQVLVEEVKRQLRGTLERYDEQR